MSPLPGCWNRRSSAWLEQDEDMLYTHGKPTAMNSLKIPDHIEILVISCFHRRLFHHTKKFLNAVAFVQLFF